MNYMALLASKKQQNFPAVEPVDAEGVLARIDRKSRDTLATWRNACYQRHLGIEQQIHF